MGVKLIQKPAETTVSSNVKSTGGLVRFSGPKTSVADEFEMTRKLDTLNLIPTFRDELKRLEKTSWRIFNDDMAGPFKFLELLCEVSGYNHERWYQDELQNRSGVSKFMFRLKHLTDKGKKADRNYRVSCEGQLKPAIHASRQPYINDVIKQLAELKILESNYTLYGDVLNSTYQSLKITETGWAFIESGQLAQMKKEIAQEIDQPEKTWADFGVLPTTLQAMEYQNRLRYQSKKAGPIYALELMAQFARQTKTPTWGEIKKSLPIDPSSAKNLFNHLGRLGLIQWDTTIAPDIFPYSDSNEGRLSELGWQFIEADGLNLLQKAVEQEMGN